MNISRDVVVCRDSIHRAIVCGAYWKTLKRPTTRTHKHSQQLFKEIFLESVKDTLGKTDGYILGGRTLNQTCETQALLKFLCKLFLIDFKEKVSYGQSCFIHRRCTGHADIAQVTLLFC